MERASLHQLLDEALDSGRVTPEGVVGFLSPLGERSGNAVVSRVLLVIGGLIIAIGIGRYVGDIWAALGVGGQIILCLLVGGSLLTSALWRECRSGAHRNLTVLQLLAHAFIGGGVALIATQFNLTGSAGPLLLAAIMSVVAGSAYTISRSSASTALLITWLSVAWFALADLLLPDQEYVTQLIVFVAGLSHLLLSGYFRLHRRRVEGFTNLTGSLLTLSPLYALTVLNQSLGMLLLVGCFVLLFLGAQWRSRTIINLSAFAFTAYLVKQVVELFSDATLALIITGLLVITLGWVSWQLQRHLFNKISSPR